VATSIGTPAFLFSPCAQAGKGRMIHLPHIERLHELTVNLGKEVVAQRDAEGLLLPLERRQYLDACKAA
jgi:hypothetical protein